MTAAMATYFVLAHSTSPAWSTHSPLDDAVPKWAPAIWVYLSIYIVAPALAFTVDEARFRQLLRPGLLLVTVTLALFALVPTVVERPVVESFAGDDSWSAQLLRLTYAVDSTARNAAPSGHVSFTLFLVAAAAGGARAPARVVLWAFAVAVCLSTLLTGQHHLADVASGAALCWLCLQWRSRS